MIYRYYKYEANSIEEATEKIKEFHKQLNFFTKRNPTIDIQITLSAITQVPLFIEIETWENSNSQKNTMISTNLLNLSPN